MTQQPTYHFDQTYKWNYDNGPDFDGDFPTQSGTISFQLLGMTINSPFGISAGILLNSNWIEVYSKLGFDILTYKTVRSYHRPCYPLPNWVFVDCPEQLNKGDDIPLIAHPQPKQELDKLTSSVCFGMPSAAPDVWRDDVARAKSVMQKGQLLIVSVVGTPDETGSLDHLAEDYAQCAEWAVQAGADAVEANLSCPNVCTAEGMVYQDEEATQAIGESIQERIGSTPLLLKVGSLKDLQAYKNFLFQTELFADGIVLLNCVPRRIHKPDGSPAFGEGKERAGVLGWGTFDICMKHAKLILQANAEIGSRQTIIPVGGVTTPDAAYQYLQAGANAVLMGGAPVFDPYFAMKLKQADWNDDKKTNTGG